MALGLVIGTGSGICCHGPAAKKEVPETPGIGSLFGPSIADLINQKPASELPPPPEPKIIDQADDKATLIFTPRHVQTDVLKDAISGMLN
ncbi:MAG: hypothetical protein ABUU24_00995, partial [Variovorax sp.]